MQLATVKRIIMVWPRRALTPVLAGVMVLALTPLLPIAAQQLPLETTQAAPETPEQLEQLVAPIALYPDALEAQILAAATYPTEMVQADRWVQQHSYLQGEQLAAAVDHQSWDASVKALTAFPLVLANLDKNLSWTEALGNAYFNQPQDVLDAVQVMRQRAEDAGNLQTTAQERVVNEGSTIIVEPAQPEVCYVPNYDPWVVYGAPVAVYPGYFYDPWYGPPFISFGPAVRLGFFSGFGWGWPAWGFNWGRRVVVFNHNPYFSRSRFFFRTGPFTGARGVIAPRRGLPQTKDFAALITAIIALARRQWLGCGLFVPRVGLGPRGGAFRGAGPSGISRGPVFRGGPNGTRPGFSGGARFGGGSRGGFGSHAGGGGGRHR